MFIHAVHAKQKSVSVVKCIVVILDTKYQKNRVVICITRICMTHLPQVSLGGMDHPHFAFPHHSQNPLHSPMCIQNSEQSQTDPSQTHKTTYHWNASFQNTCAFHNSLMRYRYGAMRNDFETFIILNLLTQKTIHKRFCREASGDPLISEFSRFLGVLLLFFVSHLSLGGGCNTIKI